MGVGAVGYEMKTERIGRRCGAMLDREDNRLLLPTDIQIGIAPCVEVAAAAEGKTGLSAGAAVFARVVHDKDREIELALQSSKISK